MAGRPDLLEVVGGSRVQLTAVASGCPVFVIAECDKDDEQTTPRLTSDVTVSARFTPSSVEDNNELSTFTVAVANVHVTPDHVEHNNELSTFTIAVANVHVTPDSVEDNNELSTFTIAVANVHVSPDHATASL